MIYIYHGDHQLQSRENFNQKLNSFPTADILRLEAKEISPDKVNLFLNSASLFSDLKVLSISNFFSISKPILDKIIKLISHSSGTIILWQDKKLTPVQKKLLPKAQIFESTLLRSLFACLNSIQPKNFKIAIPLIRQTLQTEPYDLFLYFLKDNLRKGLSSNSRFDQNSLKKAYLSLIELDFQTKTGNLSIPKEIALERIILNLTH